MLKENPGTPRLTLVEIKDPATETSSVVYRLEIPDGYPQLRSFFHAIQMVAYDCGEEELGDQIDLAGLVDDISEPPDEME